MVSGNLIRVWGAVDFSPTLNISMRRETAACELSNHFPDWKSDSTTTVLYDREKHQSLRISDHRVMFEAAFSGEVSIENIRQLIGFTDDAIGYLHVTSIKRRGLKVSIYSDLALTFEELRDQLKPLCLPVNGLIEELTGGEVEDLALHVDYSRDGTSNFLRVGPMKDSQGRRLLLSTGTIDELFDLSVDNNELGVYMGNVPAVFFYYDNDVHSTKDTSTDSWRSFANDAFKHSVDVFYKLKARIMEHPE